MNQYKRQRHLWIPSILFLTFFFHKPTNTVAHSPHPTSKPKRAPLSSFQQLNTVFRCALRYSQRHIRNDLFPTRMRQPGVRVNKSRWGMFRGGFSSLFSYVHLIECYGRSRGLRIRYVDQHRRSLSVMSGIPFFAPKQGSQRNSNKVNYYNPAWIQWATRTLIPSAKARVLGVPVQKLYQEMWQHFVRITAYTYLFLQQKNRWDMLLKKYRSTNWKGKRQLRAGLRTLVTDGYGPSSASEESYYYHAGHAATFWMRRGMDNTYKEVWTFFHTVLERFDPKFLPSLAGKSLGVIKLKHKVAQSPIITLKPQDAAKLPGLLRTAAPGTVIRLMAGTYTYKTSLKITSKSQLILEGEKPGKVRIHLTHPHHDVVRIVRSSNIIVRNLMMRHSVKKMSCQGSVVSIQHSKRVTIQNNVLDGSGSVGVFVTRTQGVTITKNHIHNNSWVGLYFTASSAQVTHNLIEKNRAGFKIYRSSITLENNRIRKNGPKYKQRIQPEISP